MERFKNLRAVTVLVVFLTMVSVGLLVFTSPTFSLPEPVTTESRGDVTVTVECRGIGPRSLERTVDILDQGRVDAPHYSRVYDSMALDELYGYLQEEGIEPRGTIGSEEYEEFTTAVDRVTANTTHYCSQLREERRTALLLVVGSALLVFNLLAFIALTTRQNRPAAERSAS